MRACMRACMRARVCVRVRVHAQREWMPETSWGHGRPSQAAWPPKGLVPTARCNGPGLGLGAAANNEFAAAPLERGADYRRGQRRSNGTRFTPTQTCSTA